MNKVDLALRLAGLTASVTIGVVGLVMESRKTTKISDEDKNDIADRVAQKIAENQAIIK